MAPACISAWSIDDIRNRRTLATWILPALLGLSMGGCGGPQQAPSPPAGAIAIGADLYMVPLAEPVEGCAAYRLYSPTKMVDQSIYYRDRQGGFTRERAQASCE